MVYSKKKHKYYRCTRCLEMTSGTHTDGLCTICRDRIRKNKEGKSAKLPKDAPHKWEQSSVEDDISGISYFLRYINGEGPPEGFIKPSRVIDKNHPEFEEMRKLYEQRR